MSLDWSVEHVRDSKDLFEMRQDPYGRPGDMEEVLNAKTDTLIWYAMVLGLNRIEAKNVDEWLFRIGFHDQLFGPLLRFHATGDYHFTRQDLERHIGLRTNVSDESHLSFVKRMAKRFEDDIKRLPHEKTREGEIHA